MNCLLWILAVLVVAAALAAIALILFAVPVMAGNANEVMEWTNQEGDK